MGAQRPPFFVFALPRSRTAWTARWLRHGDRVVGHDIAIDCNTLDDFLDPFTMGLSGSVETAAIDGWPLIREAFPDARFAVILRPLDDVLRSLRIAGFPVDDSVIAQVKSRQGELFRLSGEPGTLTLQYSALDNADACAGLWEHLTGESFDKPWWEIMRTAKVEIDMPKRIERLRERHDKLQLLHAAVADAKTRQAEGRWLRVGFEKFASFWPDAEPLATEHFAEVDGGDMPWRQFLPAVAVMDELNRKGIMQIVSARRAGVLKGYMTWMRTRDMECHLLWRGDQGGWYAEPGAGVGLKLFRRSIVLMRRLGVDYLSVHHRVRGRGADLGGVFRRLGGFELRRTYNIHLTGDRGHE